MALYARWKARELALGQEFKHFATNVDQGKVVEINIVQHANMAGCYLRALYLLKDDSQLYQIIPFDGHGYPTFSDGEDQASQEQLVKLKLDKFSVTKASYVTSYKQ